VTGGPLPAGSRIGFAGTPRFAADVLAGLLDAALPVVAVLSQPDQPSGRRRRLEPTPVKRVALARGLPLLQPKALRSANPLAALDLDLLVVVAYGRILPATLLNTPRRGCVNLHASLLPRWRGAAPVEHALLAGDSETGVCLMAMDEGLDTGPVYARAACPIGSDTTASDLFEALAGLSVSLCVAHLGAILSGSLEPTPQPEDGVTWAPKLDAEAARLDWRSDAATLDRQVRAFEYRGGAWSALAGVRTKILEASPGGPGPTLPPGTVAEADRGGIAIACGSDGAGRLLVTRLQLALGKGRPMAAADALNGYGDRLSIGARLGD
jgi:methionyl-tRNA formyltransferase